MGGRISFSGLSTGIDFQSIVDSVVAFENQRIDLVRAQQADRTTELTAIQSFQAVLLSLRTVASSLADPGDFNVQVATSSDPTAVEATVTGNAALSTQSITVNALAQAAQVASQGIAALDTNIGTGTVTIDVGGELTEITIDETNNTLQGLAEAINLSDADVTATVINDGSQSNPFRLLITGNQTGAVNTVSVATTLAGGIQAPNFVDRSIDAAEAAPANSATYTGIAQSGGTFTGTGNNRFLIEIINDGAVGVATFRFSTDGGQTFDDNGGLGYTTSTTATALADGVTISFTDSGTLTAGDQFTIDTFDPAVQDAQNASITLGVGGAPITIQSASNTVTDLIPGVSLQLNGVSANPVQISVATDTESVVAGIQSFVDAYNATLDFLDQQLDFEQDIGQPSVLLGDPLLIDVQNDIRRLVTGLVPGLPNDLNRLSAIGISTNIDTGRLQVDESELTGALASNFDGVAALFASSFGTDNVDVRILSAGPSVAAGQDFEVDITQAATSGTLRSADLTFPINITATNNELRLTVDGQESGLITLTPGTYNTATDLAAELQTQISADSVLGTLGLSVTAEGNTLLLTSSSLGSLSTVALSGTVPANNAAGILGLTGGVATTGLDVAGTINGEAATGEGNILTGNEGNLTTDGLVIQVALTQAELDDEGPEATVSSIEGLAKRLEDTLTFLTDTVDGRVTRRTNTLNTIIDDLQENIADQELRLEDRRLSLLDEFARLEASLASIQSQGELLIAQLQALPTIGSNNNRNSSNIGFGNNNN